MATSFGSQNIKLPFRVFLGSSESETNSFLVGDEVLALACDVSIAERRVYVAATDTNTVQEYSIMEDGKKNPSVVARFTSDVTCIDVSKKGDQVNELLRDHSVWSSDTL